ncbi:hypothetical protein B566_EDAN007384 [Ephemera danica]|nr:hypothetical protein B566_EDAN007384 [Ephemera danica]
MDRQSLKEENSTIEIVNKNPVVSMDLEVFAKPNYPEQPFYAGEAVNGKLNLVLDSDLNAGTYFLDIFVEGKFVLSKEHPDIKEETTFMKCGVDALPMNGYTDETLVAGEHRYDFSVSLPHQLPSTLTTISWITVEYAVVVHMLNSSKELIAATSMPIMIYDKHDLNANAENTEPVVRSTGRDTDVGILGCLLAWFRGLTPTIVCSIPLRGYVPNSCINLKVNIAVTYPCMPPTRSIEVFLVQELRLKEVFIKSYMISGSKVEGDDLLDPEFTQFGYALQVPNVPPSGNYAGLELSILYKVCLVLRIGGRARPIRLNLPINIGTVPFLEDVDIDVPY